LSRSPPVHPRAAGRPHPLTHPETTAVSLPDQPHPQHGALDAAEPEFGPFRPGLPAHLPVPDLVVHMEVRIPAAQILRVVGELDIATAPSLRTTVDEVLSTRPGRVVLDLSHVRFLSSAGLAALLDAVQRGERLGVVVSVSAASRAVRRILELTGVAELLGCGRGPGRGEPL
jgi:anti-sigma B factor antagonist